MNLPIQSAPIDRANRAINMQASARGIMPQAFPDICPICDLLPAPISGICKIICQTALK
jgi:hypothetical protein